MKKILRWLLPPKEWKSVVSVLLGIFFGLAAYAIYISKAPSYLSDKPETCINCHVMNSQYYDWAHSAHSRGVPCNDCHVPHDNIFHKYFFKARDGLRHAAIFTLRTEPQTIYIRDAGRKTVQENCLRCHSNVTGKEYMYSVQPNYHNYLAERSCRDCHRETPHKRVNGLATAPNALVKTSIESRTERDKDEEK